MFGINIKKSRGLPPPLKVNSPPSLRSEAGELRLPARQLKNLKRNGGSVMLAVVAVMTLLILLTSTLYLTLVTERTEIYEGAKSEQIYQSAVSVNDWLYDYVDSYAKIFSEFKSGDPSFDPLISKLLAMDEGDMITTDTMTMSGIVGDYVIAITLLSKDDSLNIYEITTTVTNGADSASYTRLLECSFEDISFKPEDPRDSITIPDLGIDMIKIPDPEADEIEVGKWLVPKAEDWIVVPSDDNDQIARPNIEQDKDTYSVARVPEKNDRIKRPEYSVDIDKYNTVTKSAPGDDGFYEKPSSYGGRENMSGESIQMNGLAIIARAYFSQSSVRLESAVISGGGVDVFGNLSTSGGFTFNSSSPIEINVGGNFNYQNTTPLIAGAGGTIRVGGNMTNDKTVTGNTTVYCFGNYIQTNDGIENNAVIYVDGDFTKVTGIPIQGGTFYVNGNVNVTGTVSAAATFYVPDGKVCNAGSAAKRTLDKASFDAVMAVEKIKLYNAVGQTDAAGNLVSPTYAPVWDPQNNANTNADARAKMASNPIRLDTPALSNSTQRPGTAAEGGGQTMVITDSGYINTQFPKANSYSQEITIKTLIVDTTNGSPGDPAKHKDIYIVLKDNFGGNKFRWAGFDNYDSNYFNILVKGAGNVVFVMDYNAVTDTSVSYVGIHNLFAGHIAWVNEAGFSYTANLSNLFKTNAATMNMVKKAIHSGAKCTDPGCVYCNSIYKSDENVFGRYLIRQDSSSNLIQKYGKSGSQLYIHNNIFFVSDADGISNSQSFYARDDVILGFVYASGARFDLSSAGINNTNEYAVAVGGYMFGDFGTNTNDLKTKINLTHVMPADYYRETTVDRGIVGGMVGAGLGSGTSLTVTVEELKSAAALASEVAANQKAGYKVKSETHSARVLTVVYIKISPSDDDKTSGGTTHAALLADGFTLDSTDSEYWNYKKPAEPRPAPKPGYKDNGDDVNYWYYIENVPPSAPVGYEYYDETISKWRYVKSEPDSAALSDKGKTNGELMALGYDRTADYNYWLYSFEAPASPGSLLSAVKNETESWLLSNNYEYRGKVSYGLEQAWYYVEHSAPSESGWVDAGTENNMSGEECWVYVRDLLSGPPADAPSLGLNASGMSKTHDTLIGEGFILDSSNIDGANTAHFYYKKEYTTPYGTSLISINGYTDSELTGDNYYMATNDNINNKSGHDKDYGKFVEFINWFAGSMGVTPDGNGIFTDSAGLYGIADDEYWVYFKDPVAGSALSNINGYTEHELLNVEGYHYNTSFSPSADAVYSEDTDGDGFIDRYCWAYIKNLSESELITFIKFETIGYK